MDDTTHLDAKTEEVYKEIYKEKLERETYTHGIIWKAESYFTALVSGLITASLSIARFSLYAAYGILPVAIVMTFLGRYVLIKESEYFQEYRYERIMISKKLGYDKLAIVKEFPEIRNIKGDREDYVKERVNSEKGTRYAFRLIYLFQASICLLIYWALLVSNLWGSSLLQPIDLANMMFIEVLTVIVILWFDWEIKVSLKKLDP